MKYVANKTQESTALIVVIGGSLATTFMSSAMNLAVPSIGQEFHASAFLLGWAVTAYTLGSAAFMLPMGRLADIVGRKKIFLLGFSLFGLFTFACTLTKSAIPLIIMRVLMGFGASMIFATNTAILGSVFPVEGRGKAIGLYNSASYCGLSIGPVIGGLLSEHLGWRSIFYITGAGAILLVLYAVARFQGEWMGAKGERYDAPGSALYVLGMLSFIYGFTSIVSVNIARYLALAGVILLGAFIWQETRTDHPILKLTIFRNNPGFVYSNLAAAINFAATAALSFMMSLYLQIVLGLDAGFAGLIILAQTFMTAVFSPWAGSLSDRIEPRIPASIGMGITAIGLFIMMFLGRNVSVWLVAATLGLVGVGFGMFSSPNTTAIMACCDTSQYGIASSFVNTSRNIGQSLSMAIVTVVMAFVLGNVRLGPEHTELLLRAFRITFGIFTVLCTLGTYASYARGEINAPKHRSQGDGPVMQAADGGQR